MDIEYIYAGAFVAAFVLAAIFTMIVIRIAKRFHIIDEPTSERKIHDKPIPLLGGVAVYDAFFLVALILFFTTDILQSGYIELKHLFGITLAGTYIIILGVLDDKLDLSPKKRFWALLGPAALIIGSGIGIDSLSNPFGASFVLDEHYITLFTLNGIPYKLTFLSDLFTVVWLMGMMFTTKLLDGLDGLVSGIGVIGAIVIFFVSLREDLLQYDTALLAIILAGACAGFLIFNFNPAKIFLGEGGSIFIGFMLGVLSIIAGSKIATALLIMGIPILDVVWVIIRRLWTGKKLTEADRRHLHHRFLDAGFSQRQTVLMFYVITMIFGASAIFLQTSYKFIALIILGAFMVLMGAWLVIRYKRFVLKTEEYGE